MVFKLIHYSVHAKPLGTRFIHKRCAKMEAQSRSFASVLPLSFFLTLLLVLCLGFSSAWMRGNLFSIMLWHACRVWTTQLSQAHAMLSPYLFGNAVRYSCRWTCITVWAASFVVACLFNRAVGVHMLATLPWATGPNFGAAEWNSLRGLPKAHHIGWITSMANFVHEQYLWQNSVKFTCP